jgi:hypothetical protein
LARSFSVPSFACSANFFALSMKPMSSFSVA